MAIRNNNARENMSTQIVKRNVMTNNEPHMEINEEK